MMKRFKQMRVVPFAELVFATEEGDGPRRSELATFDEAIAATMPTGQIEELASAAQAVGCADVRVLRVTVDSGDWTRLIMPKVYPCLEDHGPVFQLVKPPKEGSSAHPGLVEQMLFAWCTSCIDLESDPLVALVAYRVAARDVGIRQLNSGIARVLRWHFRPVGWIRTFEDALAFAERAAEQCASWEDAARGASAIRSWLVQRAPTGFDQLLAQFAAARPLARTVH